MFGLHKLYSKQSLLRFLWKKVHRLEKSTPTPLVALQTNISYEIVSHLDQDTKPEGEAAYYYILEYLILNSSYHITFRL